MSNEALESITLFKQPAVAANTDSISNVSIPHEQAILSQICSLAHTQALQEIKGSNSENDRQQAFSVSINSLQKSFNLDNEQISYLRYFFEVEKEKQKTYIAQRFTELEKKVTQLAKSKVKPLNENSDQESLLSAVSSLQSLLDITSESLEAQIEQKATRLTENAFLIDVKDLALARKKESTEIMLDYRDISEIAQRYPSLELTPEILERANILYENAIIS